ncbi:hypothetical protein MKX01_038234, partial [Papaver californicum]
METIHQTFNKLFKPSYHDNATSSGSYFTCEICTEPAGGCFHPYCTDCVAKYIETNVIHNNMSDIKCPDTDCSIIMDALSFRSILPKKVFENCRDRGSLKQGTFDASKGGFVHGRCFYPNRKCSEMILNEVFCFSCMVPWKENHQCRQTGAIAIDIDMDRDDVLFMEMIKRKRWVRCPNCNICIQRVPVGEGYCSHMYC